MISNGEDRHGSRPLDYRGADKDAVRRAEKLRRDRLRDIHRSAVLATYQQHGFFVVQGRT